MEKKLFLDGEAAAKRLIEIGLPMSAKTLAKLRCIGGGPSFQKWGRVPVYDPDVLDQWAAKRLGAPRASTSGEIAA